MKDRPGVPVLVICNRKGGTGKLGAHRVLAGIRSDVRLAEAFAAGKPIREYAAGSRGAQGYAALAEAFPPASMPAGQAMQAGRRRTPECHSMYSSTPCLLSSETM